MFHTSGLVVTSSTVDPDSENNAGWESTEPSGQGSDSAKPPKDTGDNQTASGGKGYPNSPVLRAQAAGQADVALQGYYLGGNQQSLLGTSGVAINSSEFLPGLGLLNLTAEGYGSNGFQTGNVIVGLEGVPLGGWHWDFVGGDFHFSSNLVANPFLNVYSPDIGGRGFRIAMKRQNRSYQIFAGEGTLLGGPRIPFRVILPQLVMGATLQQKVGKRWEFGVRFLHLSSGASALISDPTLFTVGHDFQNSNSIMFQSTYSLTKSLKFYAETGYGTASHFAALPVPQQPFSFMAGPSWDTDKFTVRANYVRQSTSYLPLLGYFAGDREGPYGEARYRPVKAVEIYGSANGYANNLEHNPDVPTFHSTGYNAGTSVLLPWKFSADGSVSVLGYNETGPTVEGELISKNRQLNFDLSRPIGRHNLRLSVIDMKLDSNLINQTQRFLEFMDTFSWKRFLLSGAVRMQNTRSTDNVNTLFFHGSIQTNIKRVSVYAYLEKGNDLVNQSVFSTNAYSSTVVGVSAPLLRGWTMQVEAYRNILNTALNPTNIFLFGSTGLGLGTQLAASNQWSFYFRISKQFRWGKGLLPGTSTIEQYAAAHTPLVGSVQGRVTVRGLSGEHPAANVGISLDGYMDTVTDATGRYYFAGVPEGFHELKLNMEQLPTDYEPGATNEVRVIVEPRGMASADFQVVPLASLTGRVVGPEDVKLQNVVIRLQGTNRYTTPYADGAFGFANLREGNYDVVIDERTLPEGYVLATPSRVQADASADAPGPPIVFEIIAKPQEEKPVREIPQRSIHIGGSVKTPAPRSQP